MKILGKKYVPNTNIKFLIILILLWISGSCTLSNEKPKTPVVKVFDKMLYAEDIPVSIYKNSDDSIRAVKHYIDQWIRNTVFIHFAEKNVDTAYINRLLEEYRQDLLRDMYSNKLKQKLRDEIQISDNDIETFYNEQKKNFPAKDTLIKWRFLIVDSKEKDRYKIKKLFFSKKQEDQQELESYFSKFLAYKTDTTGWLTYKEAKKIVPVLPKLYSRKYSLTLSQKNRLYLIQIIDMKLPGEILPLEYVKSRIKSFVIEKKLNKKIHQIQNEMLNQAYKKQKIKQYNP